MEVSEELLSEGNKESCKIKIWSKRRKNGDFGYTQS
jgi:hypothetical protein